MLTNNYKVSLSASMEYEYNSYTSNTFYTGRKCVNVEGKEVYATGYYNGANHSYAGTYGSGRSFVHMGMLSTSKTSLGTVFGNGTAEVTPDDYKLSGDIITGISATSYMSATVEGDVLKKEVVFTITNSNEYDITISECGYIAQMYATNNSYCFLFDHTLLDEPVTIPAGGVGQVTYTITFNIA